MKQNLNNFIALQNLCCISMNLVKKLQHIRGHSTSISVYVAGRPSIWLQNLSKSSYRWGANRERERQGIRKLG